MKKSVLASFLALSALALGLAGCSVYGTNGNPTELEGTWTGETKVYNTNANAITYAYHNYTYTNYAGTWEFKGNVPAKAAEVTTLTLAGVTSTDTEYFDTLSTAYTGTRVIQSSGSYTDTFTETQTRTARAAIATPTAANTTISGVTGELLAGSATYTLVKTVTLTANTDGTYTELVSISKTVAGTGSLAPIATGSATDTYTVQVSTPSFSTFIYYKDASFDDYAFASSLDSSFSVGYHQTITTSIPNSSSSLNEADNVTDTTYSLVITEAGAYTLTQTATTTQTIPAAGTTVVTTVSSGTLVGGTSGDTKVLTLCQSSVKYTVQGTGALISASYPETAFSLTQSTISSISLTYYVTNEKYLVFMDSLTLPVFTKATT
jgi:hypothetical protein